MKKLMSLILALVMVMSLAACGAKEEKPAEKPASNWPEKEITIVQPWSLGGGPDVITRQIASYSDKILGVPMIVEAIKSGKRVYAVIAPFDNAKNSSKRLHDKCTYYGVPLYTVPFDGEELAHAVGKSARLAAIAVTDEQLSRLVTAKLSKTEKQ